VALLHDPLCVTGPVAGLPFRTGHRHPRAALVLTSLRWSFLLCDPLLLSPIHHATHCSWRSVSGSNPDQLSLTLSSQTNRGEPARARDPRAATLYSVGPAWVRTMKQPCASVAGLRGSGPILTSVLQPDHGNTRVPPPRIVLSVPSRERGRAPKLCSCLPLFPADQMATGRNRTPSGIAPVVTILHIAMSSLRARATIMVILRAPFVPPVTAAIPLRQSTVVLEPKKPPSQLDQASSHAGIARLGQTLLPPFGSTFVW
jgi:hypothetical protein